MTDPAFTDPPVRNYTVLQFVHRLLDHVAQAGQGIVVDPDDGVDSGAPPSIAFVSGGHGQLFVSLSSGQVFRVEVTASSQADLELFHQGFYARPPQPDRINR